jgi:hypothetical protein
MPLRRQTSVALIATNTPIVIIDQPTGLRPRRSRVLPSASSAGTGGVFRGMSDKAKGLEAWQETPA